MGARAAATAAARISAWITTSSAVVASSAIEQLGLAATTAMAIRTRCSMPPESSCGYWWKTRSGSRSPTSVNSSTLRAWACAAAQPALDAQHLGELVADGQRRVEVRRRVLEDRAEPDAADLVPGAPAGAGQVDLVVAGAEPDPTAGDLDSRAAAGRGPSGR